ncbi:MAG: hypothetical protein JO015_04670 [Verrucomicrobia bacterium]|nr:hypothetical protein [Verrucomicrobiota bacterium]
MITLLLKLSATAWTVVVVTLCGGTAALLYLSSEHAGLNSDPGNRPAQVSVTVPTGHTPHGNPGGQNAPVPVVPEANPGLVLIPVIAAMLFCSGHRLWRVPRAHAVANGDQSAAGVPER